MVDLTYLYLELYIGFIFFFAQISGAETNREGLTTNESVTKISPTGGSLEDGPPNPY